MKSSILFGRRPVCGTVVAVRFAGLFAGVCWLACFLGSAQAASLTWSPAGSGNWDTSTLNWNSSTTAYSDPNLDNVTFNNNAGGTITVQGGGVSPTAIAVSAAAGTYTFTGGAINGGGGLTKSGGGTLAVGSAYTGLAYTGVTQIDGGVLQISHNSVGGDPSNRSLGGSVTLNGGTLRFNHTGAGNFNPVLTFTSPITVTSNGGTIDFTGAANGFTNTFGPLTLGGNLSVTGVTGIPNNNGASYNFTNGTITLTTNAKITNNTTKPANAPHDIVLSQNMSGSTQTLTLAKAGTGGGFVISGATATSMNLKGLVVDTGATLSLSASANGVDPLTQIKANGGQLTVGVGSTLNYLGNGSSTGTILDPTAIAWLGNGTLTLPIVSGGNGDSYWRITNNLEVSSASGLTLLNSSPKRGFMTVDAPFALTIGSGGTYSLNITSGQFNEYLNGNLKLVNGATVLGANSAVGGMIRGTTGTLTLGDGTGTTGIPSVVTVQGNHGAGTNTFNLGYASFMTESGTVKMKYANTTAGSSFNVGWSAGGSFNGALVALKETAGGTEFAPLSGLGGVAVVGALTGDVATFTKAVSITAPGTVGFYNRGTNNVRNTLGSVALQNDLSGIGHLAASTATFTGGSVTPGLNGVGTLSIDGNLVLGSTTALNFQLNTPGIAGSGVNDLIAVTGNLTLDGALNLLSIPSDGTYTLFTYTGTLTDNQLVLPLYATLNLSTPGVVLLTYLTPAPEPGSCLLLAGLMMLSASRRKRNAAK